MPEESILASMGIDNVKVDKLVHEFLDAQSLKILPQAPFGDAVSQFVDKDDRHAMETFVDDSLAGQQKQMFELDNDEDDLEPAMERYRKKVEQMFISGTLRRRRRGQLKPRPEFWDSDIEGEWEDAPGAYELASEGEEENSHEAPKPAARRGRVVMSDDEDEAESIAPPPKKAPAKRAPPKKAAAKAPTKAPAKKAPAKAPVRGRKKAPTPIEDDDDDEDVIMLDEEPPKVQPRRAAATRSTGRQTQTQTQLNFTQTQPSRSQARELSDDEISDDDAFEPMPASRRR